MPRITPTSHADTNEMRTHRVVIAGLARDIAGILPKTIERIERLGRLFNDYRAVIYENDSADPTRDMLQNWSDRNPRVCVVSEDRDDPVNLPSRCLSRAARMAYYRDHCQQIIARDYARFDHVILVDTDLAGRMELRGRRSHVRTDGMGFCRRQWHHLSTALAQSKCDRPLRCLGLSQRCGLLRRCRPSRSITCCTIADSRSNASIPALGAWASTVCLPTWRDGTTARMSNM